MWLSSEFSGNSFGKFYWTYDRNLFEKLLRQLICILGNCFEQFLLQFIWKCLSVYWSRVNRQSTSDFFFEICSATPLDFCLRRIPWILIRLFNFKWPLLHSWNFFGISLIFLPKLTRKHLWLVFGELIWPIRWKCCRNFKQFFWENYLTQRITTPFEVLQAMFRKLLLNYY